MIYSISELRPFGIHRSLIRRHINYLVSRGWARRCDPGNGSSPWLIDSAALPYLKSRIGKVGRPLTRWPNTAQALDTWEKTGKIIRVAECLGSSEKAAKSFLRRRGVFGKEKVRRETQDT